MGKKSKRGQYKAAPFHITIGAATSGDTGDITFQTVHQTRLVKSALLYADEVTLCSPIVHMLLAIEGVSHFSPRQQAQLLQMVTPTLAESSENLADLQSFLEEVDKILKPNGRPRTQLHGQTIILLQHLFDEMTQHASAMSQEHQIDELAELLKSGRVKVQEFGRDFSDPEIIAGVIQSAAHFRQMLETGQTRGELLPYNQNGGTNTFINDFVGRLEHILSSPETYPLFDGDTGNLVRLALREEKFKVSDVQKDRAKHLGLAASLLERLPCFDQAKVKELIDIQTELQVPLVNFRRGMMSISKEIGSASWDEDFPLEVEALFRAQVEPTILEIEENLKSNTYLQEIIARVPEKPFLLPGSSMLGLAIGQLDVLGHATASAMGIAVGGGVMASDAWKQFREKRKAIEANQFFFYYRAGQKLSE